MSTRTRKPSKVAQAYERAKPLRNALAAMNARCMEVTEDQPYGILWQRWVLPNTGHSCVIYATPDWCDAFVSVAPQTGRFDETIAAMRRAAGIDDKLTH